MRHEQVSCDGCGELAPWLDDICDHWALDDHGEDLCPKCADARALQGEHELSVEDV